MFARVATSQPRPDLVNDAIRNYHEQISSTVKNQKGFKGTLLLVDRKGGRTVGITLWESEADMRASEASGSQSAGRPTKDTINAPTVEHFEIADKI